MIDFERDYLVHVFVAMHGNAANESAETSDGASERYIYFEFSHNTLNDYVSLFSPLTVVSFYGLALVIPCKCI